MCAYACIHSVICMLMRRSFENNNKHSMYFSQLGPSRLTLISRDDNAVPSLSYLYSSTPTSLSLTIPSLSSYLSRSLPRFISPPPSSLPPVHLSLCLFPSLSRHITVCTYTTYFAIVMLRSRYIPQLHVSPLVCLCVCFISLWVT